MLSSNGQYRAEVIIRGRGEIAATEVAHDGRTFVEGRDGTEYLLRFTNHSSKRVLIVPSVDGLSVIDGKPAALTSDGFVVDAFKTATIPGWMVDQDTAAKFVFAKKGSGSRDPAKKTYAEQRGTDPTNIGVIGIAVFTEKVVVVPPPVFVPTYIPTFWPAQPYNGIPPTVTFDATPTIQLSQTQMTGIGGLDANSSTLFGGVAETKTVSENYGDVLRSRSAPEPRQMALTASAASSPSVGTGFGEATNFHTSNVEFDRANPEVPEFVFEFVYDSLTNLERMGVPIELFRPKRLDASVRNPFPASPQIGCPTPTGWKKR